MAEALAPYAEIAGMPVAASGVTAATATGATTGNALAPESRAAAPAAGSAALATLKKGLSVPEVEALLGPAGSASESKEGTMTVMKRTYTVDGKKVNTSFVGGVLIDFSITPQ